MFYCEMLFYLYLDRKLSIQSSEALATTLFSDIHLIHNIFKELT